MPTASGWELYTCSDDAETKAAVKAAVPALNAALREAKREVKARIKAAIKARELRGERYGRRFYLDADASADKVSSIIYRVVSEIMDPVQSEHSAAGAADSEPNWVAWDEVRKAAAEACGLDPREASNYFPKW